MSTFKVAGVSKFKGGFKVRFANDMTRVKNLTKSGHTDINLIELPRAMAKPAIVKYLLTTDMAKNPTLKAVFDEADEKYSGTKAVKAKKAAVVKTGGKPAAKTTAKPVAKSAAKSKKTVTTKKTIQDPAALMASLKSRAATKDTAKTETAAPAAETVTE